VTQILARHLEGEDAREIDDARLAEQLGRAYYSARPFCDAMLTTLPAALRNQRFLATACVVK